jgi:predicted PurR-regulated permease PerM
MYLNGSTLTDVMLVTLLYIGFRTVEGQYVTALLLGRHVDMNPLAVLVSIIFWGWLWGPVGPIIGVPLTMVAIVVCDQIPGFAFVGELLGGEGHTRAAAIITPGAAPATTETPAEKADEPPQLVTTSE